jgi:hypothetical protein
VGAVRIGDNGIEVCDAGDLFVLGEDFNLSDIGGDFVADVEAVQTQSASLALR